MPSEVGIQGLTASEVKGFGRQKGNTGPYWGAETVVEFVPKHKLGLAVDDVLVDRVVEALSSARARDRSGTVRS